MNNLDLNFATEQDLERMPGLGKDHAKRLIDFRRQTGTFKSWDDVKKIPGISPEILNTLKKSGVTVGGKAA
ncbi:MAG TPA: helix-hairpin-helix domain-containing protein [Terriglobia bacterium]|nr:helix-hairpin-helix domain-containing protein [Terriglobia bacterium]